MSGMTARVPPAMDLLIVAALTLRLIRAGIS